MEQISFEEAKVLKLNLSFSETGYELVIFFPSLPYYPLLFFFFALKLFEVLDMSNIVIPMIKNSFQV